MAPPPKLRNKKTGASASASAPADKKKQAAVKKDAKKAVMKAMSAMNDVNKDPKVKGKGGRTTVIVVYNDVKIKKRRKLKAKKSKDPKDAQKKEEEDLEVVVQGAPIGSVLIEQVVTKGPGGIPIHVPLDNRLEKVLPKSNITEKETKGYLRKIPNGTSVFVPEAKCLKIGVRPAFSTEGTLIKDAYGKTTFVPKMFTMEAGKVVVPLVTETGQEIPIMEVHQVGWEIPFSGYIVIPPEHGLPTYIRRELKVPNENDKGMVIAEGREPQSTFGALVRDKQSSQVFFVHCEVTGVGAAMDPQRNATKTEMGEEIVSSPSTQATVSKSATSVQGTEGGTNIDAIDITQVQLPSGTIMGAVQKKPEGLVMVNESDTGDKLGLLIQTVNAPMFIPMEMWNEEKKKAREVGADPVEGEALKQIIDKNVANTEKVLLADQLVRSRETGRPLDDIIAEDKADMAMRDKDMADQRLQLMEEYRKYNDGVLDKK